MRVASLLPNDAYRIRPHEPAQVGNGCHKRNTRSCREAGEEFAGHRKEDGQEAVCPDGDG